MNFIEGEILCIDKPLGWTSFDVVKRVRGIVSRRIGRRKLKVGHAGTLDPLASGVMIVCTGRSTKLIEQLQSGVKEYVAEVTIGATTPSYDLETAIDERYPVDHISRQSVEAALEQFRGVIEQVPPTFSAVKVDGRRAYKIARRGGDVQLKAKTLVIDEIELVDFDLSGLTPCADHPADEPFHPTVTATIRVVCSKGTYIRALARDIGQALGSGAHLTGLRRVRVGKVAIADCLSIDAATALLESCPIEFPPEEGDTAAASPSDTSDK